MGLKRRNTAARRFLFRLLIVSIYLVCVVAYFLWGIDHVYAGLSRDPTPEQQRLTSQIQAATKQLAGIPNVLAEREQQLARAQRLLAAEQNRVPAHLNINNLVRDVIGIAEDCQVKAIPLRTTPRATKAFGQYAYNYWTVSLAVKGTFEDIAKFVESADGKYLSTATVVSVQLDQDKKKPGGQDVPGQGATVTGTVELVVYTRQ